MRRRRRIIERKALGGLTYDEQLQPYSRTAIAEVLFKPTSKGEVWMVPIMDYAACNVIYVDRNARVCRLVKRGDATMALLRSSTASGVAIPSLTDPPDGNVYDNLELLLENFSSGESSV